ncbi:hypothetical protein L914_09092 [Phytophthora nicotianae]|uniref:SWIM-type domain-containing protein n=1 Tax=Phytophthora nicotianae TaxID=4792 RepID=W2NBN4_PHYNI|nr:hypothetical protein L914_09092 [Phytophthora nicotianae]
MKLPCRHAMAFKRDIGSAFIIPFSAIQPRWFGQSRIRIEDIAELATPFVAKIFKTETDDLERPLSEKEKYRRAQQAFGRIGGELSQFPDDVFESAMSQFDTWWHDMRHGNASMIATRKDTSDDKMDDDEDDSGAAGGSVGGSTPSPKEGVNEGYTRSTSPDSDGDSATPTQVANSPVGSVEIRLNGSAPKVGRPRLKCTKLKQQAKAALKEYNQGMRLRGLLRDKDVYEIVACLQEIRPALHEVTSFMKTYHVHEVKRASNFT